MFKISTRSIVTIIALITVASCSVPTLAMDLVDFTGQVPGTPRWTIPCSACGGDITIDFSSTILGDFPKWATQELDFTDPNFADHFGSSATLLSFNKLEASTAAGETVATITFPQPLGAGSALIAFDIDSPGEQMRFVADSGALGPPIMTESISGQSSNFGVWHAGDQTITAAANAGDNQKEAYVLDASGAQVVTVAFGSGAPAVANLAISAVPEPSMSACWIVCGLGALRRRRSR